MKPTNAFPDCAIGSTAVLSIDLGAIGKNYAQLNALAKEAECAAVVKADAYGTGAHRVAPYLFTQGCRTFFVATLAEGISLRALLSDVKIYILDGLFPGAAPLFAEHKLSPVLSSLSMLEQWSGFCALSGNKIPAILHIDTGMNRLGLGADELKRLIGSPEHYLADIELDLIMSHLACADEPWHRRNKRQLALFTQALARLPMSPSSLANSAGIFMGTDYHFDLVRPGIALFGGRSVNGPLNPMHFVVSLTTYIAQIRTVEKGDAIGYGAAYTATRQTRLATLPVGYADGYLRALGSSNEKPGASVYIGEYDAPLLGRVSMDLITVDITDIPVDLAKPGTGVELLGPHITVDDLADIAGTIGYEILTSLGARYDRHYLGEV